MNVRIAGLLGLALLRLAPAAVAQDGSADAVPAAFAARIAPPMRYQAAPVAPGDDGYPPLRLAADLVRGGALSARDRSGADAALSPEEREALAANGLSLWLFDQARERPGFRWPAFQVGDESFHRYRQVFLLALLRARQTTEEGGLAAEDLAATLALAQRMAGGDSQLIHFLVVLYVERRILEQIDALASAEGVPEASLDALSSAVDAGPTPCDLYARAWRVELNTFWLPSLLDAERRGEWRGPPVGDAIESASAALAAHFAECGAPAALPCPGTLPGLDLQPAVYDAAVWRWGAQRAATETLLAIRLYEKRFGRPPASLDDLVESGLRPALPRDPLTARPVGYDAAARTLWLEPPPSLIACRNDQTLEAERLEWRISTIPEPRPSGSGWLRSSAMPTAP